MRDIGFIAECCLKASMRSENYLVYLRSTSFICLYTKCTLHCNLRLIRTEIISVMITELDLRSPLTGRYVGSSRMHSASRDHPPPRRILIQTAYSLSMNVKSNDDLVFIDWNCVAATHEFTHYRGLCQPNHTCMYS